MAQDKKNEEQNGGENVDKIRDILFGEEMRVYERRFTELDQRLVREQQKLKDELNSRITKFEGFMKKEIEKLTEKDKQEKKDRVDAVKSLKDNLQEVIKELNKSIDEVDETLSKECTELRQELHDLSQETDTNINAMGTRLQDALDIESSELHKVKTGREELADLFTELALRLNKDFKLPADD
jgi:methyl-accepting chemotaxis protein